MRRFELGIHLSVGAHTHKLITTVVKQSMMPVVFGIGLGLGLAFLLYVVGSRFWIYQLRADSILFVLALPLMGIIAALACYLPVKKVMTADPIKALRNE